MARESDIETVLGFWFEELSPKQWWAKDAGLDAECSRRFEALHHAAAQGELFGWRVAPEGRLAEILLLDQLSRNIYRGRPESFAFDPLALVLAQETVHAGDDLRLDATRRSFAYMPYMHSESAAIQAESLRLFEALGNARTFDFAKRHKAIIDRFGRYPHRNAVLDRDSTAEEIAFLNGPGSSF